MSNNYLNKGNTCFFQKILNWIFLNTFYFKDFEVTDDNQYRLFGIEYTVDVIRVTGKKVTALTQKISDITKNSPFLDLSWEPMCGSHFCIIFASKIEIYQVNKQKNLIKLVKSFVPKDYDYATFTDAIWTPLGRYLVLADLKSNNVIFVKHLSNLLYRKLYENYSNAIDFKILIKL